MKRFLSVITLLLFPLAAFAVDATCPELTALQRWAGYLSWMGFLKVCGVTALAVGFCIFFQGFIRAIWSSLWDVIREVADVLAYLVSFGLIAAGAWTPAAYQLWPVFIGCICFGASVLLTIWLRHIRGDDPTIVCGILTIVWGAVAVFYGMSEIGFLAVAAFMGVLGFSILVTPLCYSFGFHKEDEMAKATADALLMLTLYTGAHVFFPHMPAAIKVFEAGAFWLGSLVGFTGLLILSSKEYVRHCGASYVWIQLLTIVLYLAGVAVGMTLGINALAGMAGTFLVFYAAGKIAEIETESAMGFGFKLMLIGGVFSAAWYVAMQHEALVRTYLTTTLPL